MGGNRNAGDGRTADDTGGSDAAEALEGGGEIFDPGDGQLFEAVEVLLGEVAPGQTPVAVTADPLGLRPAVPRVGDGEGVERGLHAGPSALTGATARPRRGRRRRAGGGLAPAPPGPRPRRGPRRSAGPA